MSVELYYNYDARYLCDAVGDPVQDIPELSFAEQPEWLIHPVRTGGAAYDFSGVAAFRAAVDADFKSETDVMCRSLAESISAGADGILVKLDTDTQRFFDVVNGQESQAAYFELAGLDASGKRIFYLIFRINARMILDPGTTDTLPETSDLFADRTYVMALLRSGWEVEYSADGTQWSSDETGAEYIRIRNRAAGGEWSDAIPLPRGADGKSLRPDAVGLLADRPAAAEEKFCYIATDTGLIYVYLSGAWSEGIPVGQDGADGRGIVSTEKTGSDGLVDHYKITYSDGSTFEYQVRNGEPGQNLKIDATGEAAELATYANAPAGFVFATSVRDENARKTTLYLYVKKSYALNDWCAPLAITYYSKGETLPLIEPLEFQSPEGDAKVLSFQLSAHPAASVASVVIDTELGELTLPYWSALGIEKIIRKDTGQVDIYFGDLCPEFETGRVYFAQGAAGLTQYQWYLANGGTLSFDDWVAVATAAVPEAPKDGRIYGRCNGAWIVLENAAALTVTGTASCTVNGALETALTQTLDAVASDGSSVTFAVTEGTLPAGLTLSGNTISGTPLAIGSTVVKITASAGSASMVITVTFLIAAAPDKMYLGYITSAVAGSTVKVTGITKTMLDAALEAETMQSLNPVALAKTSIGTVPAGALIAVLIPAAAGMKASKFDGISAKVEFELDNAVSGSGANGTAVTLDGKSYKVWGEFSLVAGERFIYVDKEA